MSVIVSHMELAVKVTHKRISLIQRTFMEKHIKHVSLLFTFHPSLHFFYQFPVSVGHTAGLG